MGRYIIESEHTPDQCLKALDELSAKGRDVLDKFEFACESGQHKAWATVDAKSESEVRRMMPESLMKGAKIVPVEKYTPEQIRSFHQK